jgi:nickel/cobalt exporter
MNILRILIAIFVFAACFVAMPRADQLAPPVKIEKRQLLVPPKAERDAPVAFFAGPMEWLRVKQQGFYGSMSASLRQMKTEPFGAAAWTLMLLGFGYGVFHAAGPGHGKAVISAWLLATESELKRGVLISFLSSIVQALAAIVIVTVVLYVIGGAVTATRAAAGILESVSFALIGALGLYLVWTAFRPAPKHDHDHHAHDEHCGHAHAPEPKALSQDWSLAKACSMAFAIGLRPCTGAILVLLAAYPLGLYWAGVLSVFAMAAGTFLTVSLIAALTVYSKHLALRLAGSGGRAVRWLDFSLRFGAGILVTFLGGALFWASLGTNPVPG